MIFSSFLIFSVFIPDSSTFSTCLTISSILFAFFFIVLIFSYIALSLFVPCFFSLIGKLFLLRSFFFSQIIILISSFAEEM